jgi:hypothetical protein
MGRVVGLPLRVRHGQAIGHYVKRQSGQNRGSRCFILQLVWSPRRRRVLDLDPVRRAPGSVRPVPPFGDDAFEPHGTSVTEHLIAVTAVDVLGQPDAVAGLTQEARQRRPPYPPSVGSQIVAIDLKQVEGAQECVARPLAAYRCTQTFKVRDAVRTTHDALAIERD